MISYGPGHRPDILVYDPFKAIVSPRPIGWIGTRNADGVPNLAPYSFFNAVSNNPHLLCFSSASWKHSCRNARDQGSFTFSLATEKLAWAMNISSGAALDHENEFHLAGLTAARGKVTEAPFVAQSPAAFECVTISVQELRARDGTSTDHHLVIGEVVQTHIDPTFIRDGRFDTVSARPIARMGYRDYMTVTQAWELIRPDD